MNIKRSIPLFVLAALALAACQDTGTVPIEDLAQKLALFPIQQGPLQTAETSAQAPTPTPAASPIPGPTPQPTATPVPALSTTDPMFDCVTAAFAPINCNFGLNRDVTAVSIVPDDNGVTITITIEGNAWQEAPAQFAVFQFDTDQNIASGNRTQGGPFGMGSDLVIFWGWTASSSSFGIEAYDEAGNRIEIVEDSDNFVTVVDQQTLQLKVAFDFIGSQTFNFVFNLQSSVQLNVNDNVPNRGEFISFPSS